MKLILLNLKKLPKTAIGIIFLILLIIIIISFGYFNVKENNAKLHVGSASMYTDKIGVVAKIASEKSTPFLFYGETISEPSVQRRYGKSVLRFPTARECLVENEQQKEQPDLSMIDWSKFHSTSDADVCLFRIAASYIDINTYKNWLKYHGFTNHPIRERHSEARGGTILDLNSTRSYTDGHGPFSTGLVQRLVGGNQSYSISSYFNTNHEVIGVSSSFTYK